MRLQRVRNKLRTARKHTKKLGTDIRSLRKQWRRDYYDREPSPETLRAMKETERIIEFWMKFHEEDGEE